jgi:molybdenum cofactor biosynthesis protein B
MGHGHHADDVAEVRCAVVTVSDSRRQQNDHAGDAGAAMLVKHGHAVVSRTIVPDDVDAIREVLTEHVADPNVDAVVFTGGTGVTGRDVTPEAIEPLFDKPLPGFGEAFRARSFDAIGPAGLLSRATAGVIGTTLVFAVPGSTGGCEQAVDELVGPLLGHGLAMVRRDPVES